VLRIEAGAVLNSLQTAFASQLLSKFPAAYFNCLSESTFYIFLLGWLGSLRRRVPARRGFKDRGSYLGLREAGGQASQSCLWSGASLFIVHRVLTLLMYLPQCQSS